MKDIGPSPNASRPLALGLACLFWLPLCLIPVVSGLPAIVKWPLVFIFGGCSAWLLALSIRLYRSPKAFGSTLKFPDGGLELVVIPLKGRALTTSLQWSDIKAFEKVRGKGDWTLRFHLNHEGAVRLGRVPPTFRSSGPDFLRRCQLSFSGQGFDAPIDTILAQLSAHAEASGYSVTKKRPNRFELAKNT